MSNQNEKIKLSDNNLFDRYTNSENFLERALKSIPLGSQTFSKSYTNFPRHVSPYFASHANGSKLTDIDGNEYIDFLSGLLSISVGYNNAEVNDAVVAQLQKGVNFSLATELETYVAEKIIEMVPCAEMVRFGKNGSDATSAAIRIARAHTKRDHVAVCGYHGWHDWYISTTTRDSGVPKSVGEMSHGFQFNNLESLEKLFTELPDSYAAVIMEPMNIDFPDEGFLQGVKDLAHKHGALLIFDEIITGFRFSKGGAQELFGVTPDLCTLGKGMGNGFPISAIAGRADLMMLLEDIFFSGTFGGEALSLAASLKVLEMVERDDIPAQLENTGQKIIDGLNAIIKECDAEDFMEAKGHPCWSFVIVKDYNEYDSLHLKTYFLQEMFARGILILGLHNVSAAHTDGDVETLLNAYREVIPLVKTHAENKTIDNVLMTEPLEPLFKVR